MQVKIFAGEHEKVEKAINRWSDDTPGAEIVSIMPLPAEKGDVTLMFIYNTTVRGITVPKIQRMNGVN